VDHESNFADTKSNRLMSPLHKMKINVELLKAGKDKKYENEFQDTIDAEAERRRLAEPTIEELNAQY